MTTAGPKLVHSLERLEWLDPIANPVIKQVARAVQPRAVRNVASGTFIGHPLHPLLTDVPIGAWTMAGVLDLIGGQASESAADLLVKVGILGALPTAASGLNDWSDTYGAETRIGLVHAAVNTTALGIYVLSARARRHGHRGRAKSLGLMGLATLVAGSYLGGHLSFVRGVNVNRTAWEEGPGEWTAVLADTELGADEHRKVDVGGIPVLLCRSGDETLCIANTCSHMGGPLDEGTFDQGCVTCPWHGSVFRLSDGGINRGPASTAQPVFETRVENGKIEIRASA